MHHFAPVLLAASLTISVALAQRPTPSFEWQKRLAVVEYGAVPLGRHSLAELPVGQTWRLGMNNASSLQLQMPALIGDTVLAPGNYRIQFQRSGETTGSIVANSAGLAVGASGDVVIPGSLVKASKPTKKLTMEWAKNGAASQGNQPVKLLVQFGETEWQGGLQLLGNKTSSVGGWKLAMFHWPAERMAGLEQSPLPLAVLYRGDDSWNLVVGNGEAKLVPWLQMPTEQNGFGGVQPPDAGLVTVGTATVEDVAEAKPKPLAELVASQLQKGEFDLSVGYEQKLLRIRLPEPKAGKPGK